MGVSALRALSSENLESAEKQGDVSREGPGIPVCLQNSTGSQEAENLKISGSRAKRNAVPCSTAFRCLLWDQHGRDVLEVFRMVRL